MKISFGSKVKLYADDFRKGQPCECTPEAMKAFFSQVRDQKAPKKVDAFCKKLAIDGLDDEFFLVRNPDKKSFALEKITGNGIVRYPFVWHNKVADVLDRAYELLVKQ